MIASLAMLPTGSNNQSSPHQERITSVGSNIPSISTNAYIAHAPISITSNADFANQATTEGWPGTGTLADPYRIEGYAFTGSSNVITITGVTVYFIIQNNQFSSTASYLIYLSAVRNGLIKNNQALNVGSVPTFIYLFAVNDTTIEGNYIEVSTAIYTKPGAKYDQNILIKNNTLGYDSISQLYGLSNSKFMNNTLLGGSPGSSSPLVTVGSTSYAKFEVSNFEISDNIVKQTTATDYIGSVFLIQAGSGINVLNNKISGFNAPAVKLVSVTGVTLSNNYIQGTGITMSGTAPIHYVHTFTGNTLNGLPINYYNNLQTDISGLDVGELIVVNTKNRIIDSISTHDIFMANTNFTKLLSSIVTGQTNFGGNNFTASMTNFGGQFISSSNFTELQYNTFKDYVGIVGSASVLNSYFNLTHFYITSASSSTVANNTFYASYLDINSASNMIISHNNFTGANVFNGYWTYAIKLQVVSNSEIKNNQMFEYSTPLYFYGASSNTITNNTFTASSDAVEFSTSLASSLNTFYFNAFLGYSGTPVTIPATTSNTFDNGMYGNYWKQYTGTDNDNNGIGDTAYLVGSSTYDNYPLMSFPDTPGKPTKPIAIDGPSNITLVAPVGNFSLIWKVHSQTKVFVYVSCTSLTVVDYSVDKTTNTYNYTFTSTYEGQSACNVDVSDYWGRSETYVSYVTIIHETDPPVVSAVQDTYSFDVGDTKTLTWNVSDANPGFVDIYINNTLDNTYGWSNGQYQYTLIQNTPGTYNIRAEFIDYFAVNPNKTVSNVTVIVTAATTTTTTTSSNSTTSTTSTTTQPPQQQTSDAAPPSTDSPGLPWDIYAVLLAFVATAGFTRSMSRKRKV